MLLAGRCKADHLAVRVRLRTLQGALFRQNPENPGLQTKLRCSASTPGSYSIRRDRRTPGTAVTPPTRVSQSACEPVSAPFPRSPTYALVLAVKNLRTVKGLAARALCVSSAVTWPRRLDGNGDGDPVDHCRFPLPARALQASRAACGQRGETALCAWRSQTLKVRPRN